MSDKTILEELKKDDKVPFELIIQKRFFSTIIGGIIGDALGVPVEFSKRNINVKDMIGYGTYNQPPGTWSDDTSLTMCLIENIIEEDDEEGLMKKFVAYEESGYWTPFGEVFDIGIATSKAISRYKKGIPPRNCGGALEGDNGNGALMRISPLLAKVWNETDFNSRVKEVEKVAEITHKHPRSTLGCIIYMELLRCLFRECEPLDAYEKTIELCKDKLTDDKKYGSELKYYNRILDKTILEASRDEIISSGYVVHSLEAAIWCFMKTGSYREAVLEAVNLGGDTDTIALITGTIAGVYYKVDGIPEEWINKLAQKGKVLDAIIRFCQYCADKESIRLTEMREKAIRDEKSRLKGAREEGIREGIKEGIKKEIKEASRETAKNFLRLGLDIEVVSKGMGLTIQEVEEIKKTLD